MPENQTVQHRAVLAVDAQQLPADQRPEPGPIAVLPQPEPAFVAAVEEAGGTVEQLSERTRGVVWLSYKDAADFPPVLEAHPGIGWVQLPFAGVDAFAGILAEEDRPGLVYRKAEAYLRAGTTILWLVDPQVPSVTIIQRGAAPRTAIPGDVIPAEPVLPGFQVDVADLFAAIDDE